MIFRIASRTVQSLFKPFFWGALVQTLIAYLILAMLLFASVYAVVHYTRLFEASWLEMLADAIGTLLVPVLAWLLFPLLFPVFLLLFQDNIVTHTCKAFYPDMPLGKNPNSLAATIAHDAKFLAITLIVNLLFLPLYLIPVINIILFVLLNGYLIGRECHDIAAGRFMLWDQVASQRRGHALIIYGCGIFITLLALIPVINLTIPLLTLIAMVHLHILCRHTAAGAKNKSGAC